MLKNTDIKNSRTLQILCFLFLFFLVWRIILLFLPALQEGEFNIWSFGWGASYQLVALYGAIVGFTISNSWGGWKSVFGKAIFLFSVGLLLQSLGQMVASYYVYTTGDIPYPGLDDIGFFGSVLAYIYGVFMLAKVSGVRLSLTSLSKKLGAVLIPLILLILSYSIFLKGYEFDLTQKTRTFLDFGYPLGQAFYIAIAILVYLLSKNFLGGIMRRPIMFIIIALVLQYVSDFTFLYQVTNGLYIPEGINDFMYFVSYFFMSFSLIQVGVVLNKIRNS